MFDTLDAFSNKFKPIFERYQIQKAIVFGSFARGEPSSRSDIDLILVQDTTKRFFDRYEGIFFDLSMAARPFILDVLIYTPQELKDISHRHFIARALREGKVIYESE